MEGKREVSREIIHYNLDMIISIGYRVNSIKGTQFRIWANKILNDYLLKGYAINTRIERLEKEVHNIHNKLGEINMQISSSLPTKEGIFYNGQIFDAYVFASELIKKALQSIVLIDNYVDESVLLMLAKRQAEVSAKIYSKNINNTLKLDLKKHNQQYAPIEIEIYAQAHDRFIIIDNEEVYHIGASLKDLGKKLFDFSKMEMKAEELLRYLTL